MSRELQMIDHSGMPVDGEEMVQERFGGPDQHLVPLNVIKGRFFKLGLQIGCAAQMFGMALVVMLISYDKDSGAIFELSHEYYPLFRGLFLICFFGACYGLVLFICKRYHVNYNAIFGVDYSHNYHYVIRFSARVMVIVFLMFMLYVFTLVSQFGDYFGDFQPSKHVYPALAVICSFVYLLWPGNLTEWNGRKQRYSLLSTIGLVLISPISEAPFSRTYLADVFTSMPKIFADAQFTTCLYITGEAFNEIWIRGHGHGMEAGAANTETCSDANGTYQVIHIVLSVLPFWIRLMQCIRGFAGSCERKHVANGLKYCCSISVVALSFLGDDYKAFWKVASVVSSLYAYFWDIHMDWGLGAGVLRRCLHGEKLGGSSEDFLLRPTLFYPKRWYYMAMITNGAARFGWAIYISPGQKVVKQHSVLIFGCIELLRRTQWSLFRLEWADICMHDGVDPRTCPLIRPPA